jgi:serine/threonine-protein kinase
MARKEKPWNDKWEIIKELSGGGQGATFLVKPKSPSETIPNETFVLKVLKNHTDPERRKRMYREVANLKTLDHNGIPRLIESNAEQFDSEVRLYMVTEFIKGETLSQAIEKSRVKLSVASELVLKLLDIIQYCHDLGVVHRDIKPDNIILRGGNFNEPMLIDFGISFNKADLEENDLTWSLQQLGNRFIALPELHFKSSLRRDPRSDITQTCGILYYVLTGLHPIALQDHKEQKPHQRPEAKDSLSYISPSALARLNGIFDRAFELSIDRRWQSTPELRDVLIRLHKPIIDEEISDTESYVARIKQQLLNSPDYTRRQPFQALAEKIINEIHYVGHNTAEELGEGFSTIQTGRGINLSEMTFGDQYGIYNSVLQEKKFWSQFRGYATGNEIVLISENDGKQIELLRVPLNSEPNFTEFRNRLRAFYIEGVMRALEGLSSVSKPDYSHFFLGQFVENLTLAKEIASVKNLPIFMVVYDDNHPTKSKLNYSLGYFLEYNTTKMLVRDHFVQVLQPLSPDVVQYIPADDPLENCLLVVLSPSGTIIQREGVYANPDEGLKRTRELITAWERISNESQ